MSIVSLQIGQCGNQVGSEFYKTIFADNYSQDIRHMPQGGTDFVNESMSTFFNTDGGKTKPQARCVQVDMEEKVIRRGNSDFNQQWSFHKPACFAAKMGSGNNWALGYLINGPSCLETVDDLLVKEFEKCDMVDGLLATMSLAGGTGSGVGTFLLRHVGDICPKVPVLAQFVWPFCRGEISVQAYNAILSMGHLLANGSGEGPDGVIMHENDLLHQACAGRLVVHGTDAKNMPVSLTEMNRFMGHQLGGLLQPLSSSASSLRHRRRLSNLLYELSGPPDFRLYQLRCLPYHVTRESRRFATETWQQIFRHGKQLLLTGNPLDNGVNWSVSTTSTHGYRRQPILACSTALRGEGASEVASCPQTVVDFTGDLSMQTPLGSPSSSLCPTVHWSARPFGCHPRALFVATNGGGLVAPTVGDDCGDSCASSSSSSTDVCAPLRLARARAWRMFASGAYLHQYAQFGMEDTRFCFLDAFGVVDQTIHAHTQLLQ